MPTASPPSRGSEEERERESAPLRIHDIPAASPLAQALSRLLPPAISASFVSAAALDPTVMAGTALDPDGNGAPPTLPPSAVPARDMRWPSGAAQWWFEDHLGRPLFAPATLLALHAALPEVARLRLVQRCGDRSAELVAHVGGRHTRASLVAKLAQVALVLANRMLGTAIGEAPDASPPRPTEALADVAGLRRRLRREDRWLTEQWATGIASRSIAEVLATGALGPVNWLEPANPRSAYFADPFGWPGHDDRILCERFHHDTQIGDLVWIEPGTPGAVHPLRPAAPTHRSYPLAWREAGQTYLMPESWTDRVTTIHRLRDDGTLEPWSTVAEGIAMSDATLFRAGGRYWIAYTDSGFGHHDNLCLMHAADLKGPWQLHPQNPVKLDIRSSRCGGTIFQLDGRWYRPAQDCSLRYGGALVVHRIDTLTPDRFEETPVATLRPDPRGPYPHGLHTLSVWGDRVLVDGKRMEFRMRTVLARIRRRVLGPR